ncbi:hypothetical protein BS78_01G125000 [Paspalum vaginatum]|nr:hypothetical protein BS78_01G125000 [Paspalum vaginatum]
MCQMISTGVGTHKGFKEVHLNQVPKPLQEFSGQDVIRTQVYNHLRKWMQRWVHHKDAKYRNKPIENYQQMKVIFGNGLATGKFAMGSNEALGSSSDFAESSKKTDFNDDVKEMFSFDDVGPKNETSGAGTKRKRSLLTEDDCVVLTGITADVNNVVDAIRETKVVEMHPDLYGVVMNIPGFTDEALLVAYSHLLDNKAQGIAFVGMHDTHRVLWLRTFLAKYYV